MSDLVINVRQIASYPDALAGPADITLVQQGGIGGPYVAVTPLDLIQPTLANAALGIGTYPPADALPGNLLVDSTFVLPLEGDLFWNVYWGGPGQSQYWRQGLGAVLQFNNQGFWFAVAPNGAPGTAVPVFQTLLQLNVAGGMVLPSGTLQVARDPAQALEVATAGWVGANTVNSFNGRQGIVHLWPQDIYCALQVSSVASEEFVCEAINNSILGRPLVFSFNGREGNVILIADDVTIACTQPLAAPQVNTPNAQDRSFRIANTAWVSDYLYGPYWTDVQQAITNAVAGEPPPGGFAPINSPNFTGIPTVPPPPTNSNSGQIASTNWVRIALASYATLLSPSFSGLPAAPTAAPGNSTAQIATTAFVMAAVQASVTGVISFNTRTGAVVLEAADLNDLGAAFINSPNFTGTPQVPMAPAGIGSAQIASTAWVLDELSAISSGVVSWNGRSGIVDFLASDLTAVGGALLASPAFSGTPTAPTPGAGNSSTQIATTAFVAGSLTNTVTTFNGRNGVVVLTANDVQAAGALVNPSPALTGVPTAPTAVPGTNTTQIASTAFVLAAIANVGSGYLPLTGGQLTGTLNLAPTSGAAMATSGTVNLATLNVTGLATVTNSVYINRSGAALSQPPSGGPTLWLANPGGNGASAVLDGWGASGPPIIQFRTAAGSPSVPTAITSSLFLGGASWIGYNGSVYATQTAAIYAQAVENWTATANGSQLVFWVTPAGSITPAQALGLGASGNVSNYPFSITGSAFLPGTGYGGCLQIPTANWIWAYPAAGPVPILAYDVANTSVSIGPTTMTRFNTVNIISGTPVILPGLGNGCLQLPINQWVYVNNAGSLLGIMIFNSTAGFLVLGQSITTQVSDFVCAGTPFANQSTFTLLSDPRVKTGQKDYAKGVSLIERLDPITYSYNGLGMTPDDVATGTTRYGFDAAVLQRIMPEMVSARQVKLHEDDATTVALLSVGDQMPLTMTLINAVKQILHRLQALEEAADIQPPLADTV